MIHRWSEFWLSNLILKVQRTSTSLFMTGVLHLDLDLDVVTGFWNQQSKFWLHSWFWRRKEHPCPLSPDLGLWRMLEGHDWGLASIYWFGYGQFSFIKPWSKFWLSILILKVQRISISFKSWFGALENFEGSLLGFCILILIWICSLVFGTPLC